MAYALTLVAALGIFLWATPAHQVIATRADEARQAVARITAGGTGALGASLVSAQATIRRKSMELLRRQFHDSIDRFIR